MMIDIIVVAAMAALVSLVVAVIVVEVRARSSSKAFWRAEHRNRDQHAEPDPWEDRFWPYGSRSPGDQPPVI